MLWNRFAWQHKLFVKSNRNCHNKSKLHFKDTSVYNFTSIVVAFCFLHSYNLFNLRVNKQKIVIQISSSSHTSTFSSHSPIICFILIKFQAMDWVLATPPKDLWDLFGVGSQFSKALESIIWHCLTWMRIRPHCHIGGGRGSFIFIAATTFIPHFVVLDQWEVALSKKMFSVRLLYPRRSSYT